MVSIILTAMESVIEGVRVKDRYKLIRVSGFKYLIFVDLT
jgi:hypothetical protein